MNQSEFEANTSNRRQARENTWVGVLSLTGFPSFANQPAYSESAKAKPKQCEVLTNREILNTFGQFTFSFVTRSYF